GVDRQRIGRSRPTHQWGARSRLTRVGLTDARLAGGSGGIRSASRDLLAHAVLAYCAARTGVERVPSPEIVTSTVSPSTIGPTPAGVPVRITSPGSSVNTLDA